MDNSLITNFTKKMGLTMVESKIYFYLLKCKSPKKGGEIADFLQMHRSEIYRTLTSLQNKGFVKCTLERPIRFFAVPIEEAFSLYIKKLEQELRSMIDLKNFIIRTVVSAIPSPDYSCTNKFSILKGKDTISAKIAQMTFDAKKEILHINKGLSHVSYDQKIVKRRDIKWRVISDLSQEDLAKAMFLREEFSSKLGYDVDARYLNLESDVKYAIHIVDDDGVLVFLDCEKPENMTALWTNNKVFVQYFKISFEKLWRDAIDVNVKIDKLFLENQKFSSNKKQGLFA